MKRLLEKYRKGRISHDELEKLSARMDNASDLEIAEILEKEWMHESIRSSKRKIWTGIAAGFLLVTALSSALYLAKMNKDFDRLSDKYVAMESGSTDRSAVVLPDGTKVMLNANSRLEYASDFGVRDRKVRMVGQGYFDVAKDPQKAFTVDVAGMEIAVHGTKFNVYAYPDNDFREVSLIEGSISLHYGDSEVFLSPNEKVCISGTSGRMNILRTDNSVETAWMENRIIFIAKPLYQVIDILQRHFGVQITCSGDINLTDRYTGTFNDRRIDDILDILKMHYGFDYAINGNRVEIR
ncbi:MAG: FecR family protein [Candidatus Cryptobacteroides sp.]